MLVFRILATVFVALSVITSFLKNVYIFYDEEHHRFYNLGKFIFANLYGVLWRAFVITAIWLI